MMHVPPEGSSTSIPNNLIFKLLDVLLASNHFRERFSSILHTGWQHRQEERLERFADSTPPSGMPRGPVLIPTTLQAFILF